VPFTLVHTGKYRTEDKLKTHTIQKLKTTQKKQTMQNTAEKTSLVQSLLTTLSQKTRWVYSTKLPSPHGGQFILSFRQSVTRLCNAMPGLCLHS